MKVRVLENRLDELSELTSKDQHTFHWNIDAPVFVPFHCTDERPLANNEEQLPEDYGNNEECGDEAPKAVVSFDLVPQVRFYEVLCDAPSPDPRADIEEHFSCLKKKMESEGFFLQLGEALRCTDPGWCGEGSEDSEASNQDCYTGRACGCPADRSDLECCFGCEAYAHPRCENFRLNGPGMRCEQCQTSEEEDGEESEEESEQCNSGESDWSYDPDADNHYQEQMNASEVALRTVA